MKLDMPSDLKTARTRFVSNVTTVAPYPFLQCFDAVGWAAGRASGL